MQIARAESGKAKRPRALPRNSLIAISLVAASLISRPAFANVNEGSQIAIFRDGVVSQFDAATNHFDLAGPEQADDSYAPAADSKPLIPLDDEMRQRLAPVPSEGLQGAAPRQQQGPDLLQAKYQWRNMAKLEIAFQILNAVDTAETAICLRKEFCSEANPLLSRNPSTARLIATKALSGVVHYAITRMIFKSDPEAARYWLIGSLVVQGGVVGWNAKTCF